MSKHLGMILGAALLPVAMWIWVQDVAIPRQQAESTALAIPRGNLSDLYPRWLGTRELLLHHRDPYHADITREIQTGYYGRPLDPTRPNDPKDQQAFAYPIYVVVILAPTAALPFWLVHRIFFWLFVALTAASIPLWMRTIRWRVSAAALVIWILLTLTCFPAIQALKLQQLTLLVAGLMAGAIAALVRRRPVLAGILLALATIKPQLVLLLVVWLLIWIAGAWRERQRLLWSFLITVLLLVLAGELLLPGWITEFRAAANDYYRYTGGGNLLVDLFGSPLWGGIVSALLIGMLLIFAWQSRHAAEETLAFQWSLCFTLATTLLVIRFSPYNEVLLLPAVMLALRARKQLWSQSVPSRFLCSIAAFSIAWPYVAAACLVIALAFLPGPMVQKAWGLAYYPNFAIPIAVYALLLASRRLLRSNTQAMSV